MLTTFPDLTPGEAVGTVITCSPRILVPQSCATNRHWTSFEVLGVMRNRCVRSAVGNFTFNVSPYPIISPALARALYFSALLSWHCFGPNPCARQLRPICFALPRAPGFRLPGQDGQTILQITWPVPPKKLILVWKAGAFSLSCPRQKGRKGDFTHVCSYELGMATWLSARI
jgi:hypothetical protein